jgi:hypothetical protein
VIDAHEIADDDLSKRVDRPHRVQHVEPRVDRSSDRGQVQIQLAGGDRLQQQAVRADRRRLARLAGRSQCRRGSPGPLAAERSSAH